MLGILNSLFHVFCNKNADSKIERLEGQIIYNVFGSNKTKVHEIIKFLRWKIPKICEYLLWNIWETEKHYVLLKLSVHPIKIYPLMFSIVCKLQLCIMYSTLYSLIVMWWRGWGSKWGRKKLRYPACLEH